MRHRAMLRTGSHWRTRSAPSGTSSGARASLEKVVALKAMTAQSWADYADTLASLNGGSLGGAAGNAIDSALALDANNTKALWLKASQAHEQRRFGEALTWWKKLRALLPPDSSDARIIDSNIAEDTQLAGGSAGGSGGHGGDCSRRCHAEPGSGRGTLRHRVARQSPEQSRAGQ